MNQKTYQTFPYVPLEISKFRHIYDRNGAANPYNKRSEKDYMKALEEIYPLDKKPFEKDLDFDLMTIENIGLNICHDYHDCLEMVNSHKDKLFCVWDLSYLPTFIIHDIWNGKIYTYAHPELSIEFKFDIDKKRFPVHAECLNIWNNKSISEYGRLKWLFENSDHVGYYIPNPDVTGRWKDIVDMMKSLGNIPHHTLSLMTYEFDAFVDDLQYKPNPNRKYHLEYDINYIRSFKIKRME